MPLIEGTTVSTKHGPIKTDHILFIASGAFQLAKPSDLLPELQGRLPIRVELSALNEDDFKRILKEPDNSLIKQYKALLKTENVDLEFTEDGIKTLAKLSAEVNSSVENIGARRLHTIIEKVLDDISFNASNSTLIGSLPCNSGSKSEGFASWKAPDAINKIWSVFIGPYFVLTVVPSIKGN